MRDHCYFTGKFRGAAHNLCNLKYRRPKFTPVLFHNLSGYDALFFIKNLGGIERNIDCIKGILVLPKICVGKYTNKKANTKKKEKQNV